MLLLLHVYDMNVALVQPLVQVLVQPLVQGLVLRRLLSQPSMCVFQVNSWPGPGPRPGAHGDPGLQRRCVPSC